VIAEAITKRYYGGMSTKELNPRWVPTKKFFSDALLVAILTGAGYLSAFAYQFNYLHYFGIPVFFIDVNLGSVLLTMAIGFLVLLSLGACVDIIFSYDLKNKALNIIKALLVILVMLFIIFIPILGLYFNLNNNIVFVIALVILAAFVIGTAIYVSKNPGKFADKKANDLLYMAEKAFGSFPVLFVAILIFFVVYCGGIGKIVAQGTTSYLVSNTNPELIIISTYSENFIGLKFNSSTKTFYKDVTLISTDEISRNNIVFHNENIGPLKSN
jgi:hypothetical protein